MQELSNNYSDLGFPELNSRYPEYGFSNDEIDQEWKINQEIIKDNGGKI